jgi:hypothetical protein
MRANTGYAAMHYKASRGYCDRGMYLRKAEALAPNTCTGIDFNRDGVLDTVQKGAYDRIRIEDVVDGTSKTIAIGESAYYTDNVSDKANFPIWAGSWNEDGAILFKTQDVINCNLGGPRNFPLSEAELDQLPGGSGQDDCVFSWHKGGAFFGFVDGSVHFLSEAIELRLFAMLGDRLDGQFVGDL